ncbi:MAG: hypothetical protein ACTSX4_08190 [Candidatus Helarchaeota archaeon]
MFSRKFYILFISILLIISPIFFVFLPVTNFTSKQIIFSSKNGNSGLGQYVVVPITVYQVEGSTITPQDVQDLLARLNKLYNCEVAVFVWNGIILPVPDPNPPSSGGPGSGGSIVYPTANNSQEHDNLSESVNNHPMNPTNPGIQLVVCNEIVNSSGQSVAGGYAYSGQGPIVVAQHCASDKEWGGKAWAHEIGHFFGLDHNGNNASRPNNNGLVRYDSNGDGVVNGSDVEGSDGNGDGFVTVEDQNYLMYGGFPPGTELTPVQHSLIFNAAKAMPGAQIRTLPRSGTPPCPPNIPVQISGNRSAKPVNQSGPVPTNKHRNVDLQKYTMFRNLSAENPVVKVVIHLNGSIINDPDFKYGFIIANNVTIPPDTEYNVTYTDGGLYFSNRTIGASNWNNFIPFPNELSIEFNVSSDFLTGDMNLTSEYNQTQLDEIVNNTDFNEAIHNSTLTISLNGSFVNSMFGNDVSGEASYNHNITIFASQIDDGDLINDNITTSNAYLGNITGVPYILTSFDHANPGNNITISVFGFSPNVAINITLDGEIILSTITDATGNATLSYIVPEKSTDHYVLAVMDEDNHTSAMYLHIQQAETPSTSTPPIPGFEFLFIMLGLSVVCIMVWSFRRRLNKLTLNV